MTGPQDSWASHPMRHRLEGNRNHYGVTPNKAMELTALRAR
jgi:hypothetical protein